MWCGDIYITYKGVVIQPVVANTTTTKLTHNRAPYLQQTLHQCIVQQPCNMIIRRRLIDVKVVYALVEEGVIRDGVMTGGGTY